MPETIAGLFAGWTPTLPCEDAGHDLGLDGCEPGRPGEYVVEVLHALSGGIPRPDLRYRVVCRGRAAWLRTRANNHTVCPNCGASGPMDTLLKVTGHVSEAPHA